MDRSRLNIDAVESFAVFSDSMNFSVAAKQLHISQPALHVKIRKLSEQLDLPLYQRHGRELRLTVHGENVARFGREMLDQTRGFMQALTGEAGPRRLVLAGGEGAYMYLLGNGVRRFLRSGRAGLQLLTRDRDGALDAVLSGRAQLGVAPLETVPAGLDASALADVGQMLVVPNDHPLAKRRRLELDDLRGAALVVPPEDRPHRQMLARLLQSAQIPWTVAVEAGGWELTIRFVQMGVGVAVVNACCAVPRGLKGIPVPTLPALRYHLFHMKGARKDPLLRCLIADLIHHANDWKPA